jgi:hypothetical protein
MSAAMPQFNANGVLTTPASYSVAAAPAKVPSRSVLKLADASSAGMMLSDHAARSMV